MVNSVEMSLSLYTKGESDQNPSGLQGHAETAFHHSVRVILDDWVSDSNSLDRYTSPFVLLSASMVKEQAISDVPLIHNKGHSGTRSSAVTAVAEGSSIGVERQYFSSPQICPWKLGLRILSKHKIKHNPISKHQA